MQVSLQSKAGRAALVAVSLIAALAYSAVAVADVLAAYLAGRSSPSALEAAARLRPGNAKYHYLLGRYRWLVQQAPDEASQSYLAATRLNPYAARYWLELAATYQWLGKEDAEIDAVNRAIRVDPRTPNVAWDAANYLLIHGDIDRALQEYQIVLAYDPFLYPAALQAVWRIKPDADFLLQKVVPPNAEVYSFFLGLLESKNETAAAARVWDRLQQLRQPVPSRIVFGYVAYLVNQRDADQATRVWQQAAALCSLGAYQPSAENLVVNGDFSQEVLNGGFDWHYDKRNDVDLALDPVHVQAGRRSLLMDFNSHGLKDAGVWHLIAVRPNTNYKFSANFKADGIEGVGGPRVTLQDQFTNETYFASDYIADVDHFNPIDGEFTTGPDAKLLVLRVQRDPAGSPIKGKLWLDGVRLVESFKH